MAYELALPPGLSGVHPVFHVSMLKRYHGDGNYIIRWDSVLLDDNLSYEEEPVAILDREIRKLRSREIASIKVQWKNRHVEEATWEKEADMRERYHTSLQIQVLLLALVFLLVIVRGRTMGKLVSIVTTCLVILSSRFYFWKNRLRRRNPRRNVMGTTERHGHDGPSRVSRFKTLRNSEKWVLKSNL